VQREEMKDGNRKETAQMKETVLWDKCSENGRNKDPCFSVGIPASHKANEFVSRGRTQKMFWIHDRSISRLGFCLKLSNL
jgi:hypothetical protein